MRRYIPKKDIAVCDIAGDTGGSTEVARACWRLYLFWLAEELFPKQFAELKRRVLPLYERSLTQPNSEVLIRRGHLSMAFPASVELEDRIARWAKKLGIFSYSAGDDDLLKRDLWLRSLALQRVQSWHDGAEKMPVPVMGGIPGRTVLRRDRGALSLDPRRAAEVYGPMKATYRWRHHFVWFLRYRIQRITLEKLASQYRDEHTTACSAPTVLSGIRSVSALLGFGPKMP